MTGFVVTVALFAVILGGLPLLARHVRRTGVGGGLLGPLEEVWGYPDAHRARFEIEAQVERRAPAPSPGDSPDAGNGSAT
ncbi:hypothetical protein FHX82_002350 [Amycolatopsis bartoniae]|nr:hypothetical protein [Amycolatopsis bartoniae]MBB2935330.1 hypothetical protein [Amycolatopsis bartoniae]TVT06769.1 hypothetical protein FNH07_18540 [Amycolatopsis bartoniae]